MKEVLEGSRDGYLRLPRSINASQTPNDFIVDHCYVLSQYPPTRYSHSFNCLSRRKEQCLIPSRREAQRQRSALGFRASGGCITQSERCLIRPRVFRRLTYKIARLLNSLARSNTPLRTRSRLLCAKSSPGSSRLGLPGTLSLERFTSVRECKA